MRDAGPREPKITGEWALPDGSAHHKSQQRHDDRGGCRPCHQPKAISGSKSLHRVMSGLACHAEAVLHSHAHLMTQLQTSEYRSTSCCNASSGTNTCCNACACSMTRGWRWRQRQQQQQQQRRRQQHARKKRLKHLVASATLTGRGHHLAP